MRKTILASFFTLLFTLLLVTPTVLSFVENTCDISVFFNANDEENKDSETNKTLELIVLNSKEDTQTPLYFKKAKTSSYYAKNYSSFSLENFSPPPEFS